MIKRYTVRSLHGLIRTVREIRDEWTGAYDRFFDPWFRGQADSDWTLMPSIYRQKLDDAEEEIRAEFIRQGIQFVQHGQSASDWGWYFLMRHHGCVTRLLDWTDSAAVAVFFAVNSNPPQKVEIETNPTIWMLDPWWLNKQVLGNDSIVLTDWPEARPYLPRLYDKERLRKKLPIAIDPPHVARRVSVQRSRFTVHGTDPHGLETVASRSRSPRLARIDIAGELAAEQIRVDLRTFGVTDAVVFPDLGGLSSEITRYWHTPWFGYE